MNSPAAAAGFGERLDVAMAASDLTLEHTAQAIDRSPSTLYRWLAASQPPRLDDIAIAWKLADATHTAARYLLTGEGGPFQRPGMSEAESALLDQFRMLPPAERAEVEALCTRLYHRRYRFTS